MAGYTRQDSANDIATGKTIKSATFDAEYDQIEVAFDSTNGHSHDGSTDEGAPIEVTGPAQDYLSTVSGFTPKTSDTYDLGSVTLQWKDLYVDGVAYLDSVDIDGGSIDGTPIGGTTASTGSFTTVTASVDITGNLVGNVTGNITGDITGDVTGNLIGNVTGDVTGNLTGNVTGNVTGSVTGDLTGNADTATALETGRTITLTGDATGVSGSFNGTANTSITVTVVDDSHSHTLSTITDSGTIASQDASNVTITGGSISGITDLAIADGGTGASTAAAARVALGVAVEFIATADASNSATIDFTGFDASRYDGYLFLLANIVPATDGASLWLRTSSNGGVNYESAGNTYNYSHWNYTAGGQTGVLGSTTSGQIEIANVVGSDVNEHGVSGEIRIVGPHLAQYTQVQWSASFPSETGDHVGTNGTGERKEAAAVDAVRFIYSTGSIESGTITMYGYRNA